MSQRILIESCLVILQNTANMEEDKNVECDHEYKGISGAQYFQTDSQSMENVSYFIYSFGFVADSSCLDRKGKKFLLFQFLTQNFTRTFRKKT